MNFTSGLALATTAAALFSTLAAPVQAASHAGGDMTVKCSGVNSCKGTSECKTAKSECKGHNSCKGQGWVSKKSADECTKAGGSVIK
ncbi:MAG: hypothetical protein KF892_17355 [Rhizobacter sp.]|nr:hypothetical protein [Rhizobacter sp.]